jgi:hypothetical protein
MHRKLVEALAEVLVMKGYESDTIPTLTGRLTEGSNKIQVSTLPAFRFVSENLNAILDHETVLDDWVGALIFLSFAQGIAAGQGREHLTAGDLELSVYQLCTTFPTCYLMRVEQATSAFSLIVEDAIHHSRTAQEPEPMEEY